MQCQYRRCLLSTPITFNVCCFSSRVILRKAKDFQVVLIAVFFDFVYSNSNFIRAVIQVIKAFDEAFEFASVSSAYIDGVTYFRDLAYR